MAYALICVIRDKTILDYAVFSKELSSIEFDNHAVGLALRHDPCFGWYQYFIISFIPHINPGANDCATSSEQQQLKNFNSNNQSNKTDEERSNHEVPIISFINLNIDYRTHIHLHGALAYHCFNELRRSVAFRESFIRYVRSVRRWTDVRDKVCACQQLYDNCEVSLSLPLLIEINLVQTIETVCLSWCYRVEDLVKKRYLLEDTMNWLSTLGGGYSSLGDYFHQFSEKAQLISLTQFKIAMEMRDPIMTAKCRLFYALSQMQQGNLQLSKIMIRREYYQAKHLKITDQKLLDMCRGMWSKLQYFYTKRKTAKTMSTNLSAR